MTNRTCNCTPVPPQDPETPTAPDTPVVVPPAAELPRASKLNIPLHTFLNLSPNWYTEAREIPVGDMRFDHVSVSEDKIDIPYYPQIFSVAFESNPLPDLSFPDTTRVIGPFNNTWRVYPTESDDYYFEVSRVVESEDAGFIKGRFDVSMIGGDSPEAQAIDIPVTVSVEGIATGFTIHVDAPAIEPSTDHVWLVPSAGYTAVVEIKSNLHWWINI